MSQNSRDKVLLLHLVVWLVLLILLLILIPRPTVAVPHVAVAVGAVPHVAAVGVVVEEAGVEEAIESN